MLKCPHLGENIFNQLDNQNLTKCKKVSRSFYAFLENNKLLWTRIMKKYTVNHTEFEKDWKSVLEKTPVENIKQLAIAVEQFYMFRPHRHFNDKEKKPELKYPQHSPLHIAAERGNLSLCIYIGKSNF